MKSQINTISLKEKIASEVNAEYISSYLKIELEPEIKLKKRIKQKKHN